MAGREKPNVPTLRRVLLACGLIGPPLFIVVLLIAGATRPGYSAWHDFVSDLSLGPQGWEQIANFLVCGALSLCFAAGLRLTLRSGKGSVWGPIHLSIFGLGLMLAGVFVTDPVGARPTLHGVIHNNVTPLVFVALALTCFVLARRFAGDPSWKGWALYSVVTGALVIVFFVATNVVSILDQNRILHRAPVGLLQRIAILIGWSWIALLAYRLLRGQAGAAAQPREG
jgi:hypothetical membrane protein